MCIVEIHKIESQKSLNKEVSDITRLSMEVIGYARFQYFWNNNSFIRCVRIAFEQHSRFRALCIFLGNKISAPTRPKVPVYLWKKDQETPGETYAYRSVLWRPEKVVCWGQKVLHHPCWPWQNFPGQWATTHMSLPSFHPMLDNGFQLRVLHPQQDLGQSAHLCRPCYHNIPDDIRTSTHIICLFQNHDLFHVCRSWWPKQDGKLMSIDLVGKTAEIWGK